MNLYFGEYHHRRGKIGILVVLRFVSTVHVLIQNTILPVTWLLEKLIFIDVPSVVKKQ
jgi:hypothetical protein